jgi:hypothetical protein
MKPLKALHKNEKCYLKIMHQTRLGKVFCAKKSNHQAYAEPTDQSSRSAKQCQHHNSMMVLIQSNRSRTRIVETNMQKGFMP